MVSKVKAPKTGKKLVLVSVIPQLTGEEFIGFSPNEIGKYVAHYAQDDADLSSLTWVREKEAEIMKLVPSERNRAFTNLSPLLKSFSQNEASFKALESVYTNGVVQFNGLKGVDDGGVFRAWSECYSNARAVRERKTITTTLLVKAIKAYASLYPGKRVELVSIASGSARCIIEALAQLREYNVHARMLDWDEEAREYSNQLACDMGVGEKIETLAGDVIRIKRALSEYPVHIAEAVGIIDYLDDRTTQFLLKQVHEMMVAGGTLVASNIAPNHEMGFVHTAIRWRPMHYRTDDEFACLFDGTGFMPNDCKLHLTPIGIYSIIEATKAYAC